VLSSDGGVIDVAEAPGAIGECVMAGRTTQRISHAFGERSVGGTDRGLRRAVHGTPGSGAQWRRSICGVIAEQPEHAVGPAMHLRSRELSRQQLDGCGIDFGTPVPAVRDEVDVLGGVHGAQRRDAMVDRVANVEARVEHAPVQQSVTVGALGMRDGLAAPKEALRVVVGRSRRVVDAHVRLVVCRRCGRAPLCAKCVRKITTLPTHGYMVESVRFVLAPPN
jgi:hypothetical protein